MEKNNAREKMNAFIEILQLALKNGKEITEQEISEAKNLLNSSTIIQLAGYNEEELKDLNEKIAKIEAESLSASTPIVAAATGYTNADLTKRSISIPKIDLSKVSKRRIASALAVIGIAVGVGLYAYSNSNNVVDAAPKTETVKSDLDIQMQQIKEDALRFAQNEIDNGLPKNAQITDENKEVMMKSLVTYYLLNQVNELDDEEWACIFQDTTITAEDIMRAESNWEFIDQQRVMTVENHLDYNLLFDKKDAQLLNTSAEMLNAIKANQGEEKEKAIIAFKEYITSVLADENVTMQYSERALDVFRDVYFDSFDELVGSNRKYIDDELYHYVQTTMTCSSETSDLDVADNTVYSLESKYEINQRNKIETRLQNGWFYATVNSNKIDKSYSLDAITEYVVENIDLSKQFALPSIEEVLLTDGGEIKSANDSGVSDGKGGNISSSQFDRYNINPSAPDARQQLENAVRAEESVKEEASESVTDRNGQVIVPSDGNPNTDESANYAAEFSEGYNDGVMGQARKSGRGAAYNNGYNAGSAELESKRSEHNQESETFVPLNANEPIAINSISNYTYDATSDINALQNLKMQLLANVDEELNTNKTL